MKTAKVARPYATHQTGSGDLGLRAGVLFERAPPAAWRHGPRRGGDGAYAFLDGHAAFIQLHDTGNPDCRWHNGEDLTISSIQPQPESQKTQHDHPDWKYLVQPAYLP